MRFPGDRARKGMDVARRSPGGETWCGGRRPPLPVTKIARIEHESRYRCAPGVRVFIEHRSLGRAPPLARGRDPLGSVRGGGAPADVARFSTRPRVVPYRYRLRTPEGVGHPRPHLRLERGRRLWEGVRLCAGGVLAYLLAGVGEPLPLGTCGVPEGTGRRFERGREGGGGKGGRDVAFEPFLVFCRQSAGGCDVLDLLMYVLGRYLDEGVGGSWSDDLVWIKRSG